jgi:sorting nexin-25
MAAISDQLAGLLRLVLRDFVGEWFDEISDDAAFPIAVEKAVRTAIVNLRERMFVAVPDPTDTMVRKFLPMFTAHLMDFTNAERAVRGSRVLTESEEVDKIVATRYGALRSAGVHPATALSFSDPTLPQQEWLRALMERVLPLVMPEKEAKSRAVLVLVREIISCAVLYPVMNLLADPDVWNQLIEHVVLSSANRIRLTLRLHQQSRTVGKSKSFETHYLSNLIRLRNVPNKSLMRS